MNEMLTVPHETAEEINKWAILRWRREKIVGRSKYMPHNGEKEKARRRNRRGSA